MTVFWISQDSSDLARPSVGRFLAKLALTKWPKSLIATVGIISQHQHLRGGFCISVLWDLLLSIYAFACFSILLT